MKLVILVGKSKKYHMKKTTLVLALIFAPFLSLFAQQGGNIRFSNIRVEIKGQSAEAPAVTYPFVPGKQTGEYQLFVSDSLVITGDFKLVANKSRRSQVMDSSVKLYITYSVMYKGDHQSKKAEKIYFLDDSRSFNEKEVVNFQTSKFSNTIVRLSFTGTLSE